jgi:Kef-type K+ transport system membrane component KefB
MTAGRLRAQQRPNFNSAHPLFLVAMAQLFGYFFTKLRQPKVVSEILATVVLGPAIVGRLSSASWILETTQRQANILNFVYWLGLLSLMSWR